MECLNCGNCKTEQATYFCLKVNDFVVNEEVKNKVIIKGRGGWKKGDPEYESHRRSLKKQAESV